MIPRMTAADAVSCAEKFFQENNIQIASRHREQFASLVERFGAPFAWSKQRKLPDDTHLVVVAEPPSSPNADNLYRAMSDSCVVVVPFAEHPGFDFLKSKFKDFGSVGVSPSDWPHEMWWGGLKWSQMLSACPKIQQPLILSCYARDRGGAFAEPLQNSIKSIGLDAQIEPIKTRDTDTVHGAEKAKYILDVRRSFDGPILWVEPDARFGVFPSLITKMEYDFAVHRWNRWQISPRTIGIGAGDTATQLLNTWRDFAFQYPKVWEGYVVDQAWSLVSSQLPLKTLWLPRSYHAAVDEQGPNHTAVVIHSFRKTLHDLGEDQGFPKGLRPARRASRIGAPEPSVVVRSPQNLRGSVSVIITQIDSTGAREVARTVDAIVEAFHNDSAGFGQLELSLCQWTKDAEAAATLAQSANNHVIQIKSWAKPTLDLFHRFSEADNSAATVVPLGSAVPA